MERRPHKNRLPKFRRTIPVKGIEEDQDKYFRCWNCGFICKVGRDALNDGPVGITPSVVDPNVADCRPVSGDSFSVMLLNDGHGRSFCLMQLDAAGDPKEIYVPRAATVTSGCPQCGIHTWRG